MRFLWPMEIQFKWGASVRGADFIDVAVPPGGFPAAAHGSGANCHEIAVFVTCSKSPVPLEMYSFALINDTGRRGRGRPE